MTTSPRVSQRRDRTVTGPGGRPLRVAHLTTVDISLSLLLATELASDVEAGLRTFALSAPGDELAAIEATGARHIAIPALTRAWSPEKDLRAAIQLYRTLRELDLDVLHTHNPKTGVLGRVLGRAARIPVIVNTCHGLWYRNDSPRRVKALVLGAESFAAAFSDAELFQNADDRAALLRAVSDARAAVVGNGIDLTRFRPDEARRATIRSELGVGPDEVLVGGVGRRVAEKGIHEYAEAAHALASQARFVWVGPTDPDKPDHIDEESDRVRFLGARRDMEAIYAALDVFVLPSYREGFSRSAMEAAASGTAMVLSDIRGCRELGRNEEDLLLTPPRDPRALTAAIERLINDGPLRRRLAEAARTRANLHFDQRSIAETSIRTYLDVARKKGLDWRG